MNRGVVLHFWNNPNIRAVTYQAILVIVVFLLAGYFFQNTQHKLKEQNISTGFSFLEEQASFDVSESVIQYSPENSYGKVLMVGVLNTLKMAIIGNILAVILGIFIGLARGSKNFLISRISGTYIELFRNIPLLLQILFWYSVFAEIFPSIREAWNPLPGVFISNRGFNLASPIYDASYNYALIAFVACLGFLCWFMQKNKQHKEKTGKERPLLLKGTLLVLGLPLLTWYFSASPLQWDVPRIEGFNFEGGYLITPEFSALLVSLVIYTAAFIGEVVRAGVESVHKGQWEAAESLGLSTGKTLQFVVIPQALRVIIPPVTSLLLNLTKNSSLAVAIAYPDFVSIANTIMNQTGQAIELVLLIMLMYLFFSLSTSIFMNWYNKKIALMEK